MFGFLYARPGFFEGIARLMDFTGTLNEYNRSVSPDEADMRALRADWLTVGDDLRSAAESVIDASPLPPSQRARILKDRRLAQAQ